MEAAGSSEMLKISTKMYGITSQNTVMFLQSTPRSHMMLLSQQLSPFDGVGGFTLQMPPGTETFLNLNCL
jgi:hypothetical protein